MAMSPLATAIAMQQAARTPQEQIQPANVLGAYQLASDVAEKNYQAKLQAQMGMWGGLASLGAAGILGYPALKKAFASAANAAAPASTSAGGAAAGSAADTGAAPLVGASDAGASSLIPDATAPAAADFSIGDIAPSVAPTIASDYGLTGAGTGAASLLGGDAAGAAGSIAADMGAADAAGAVGADAAAATLPDWLSGLLAFF